MKKRKLGDIPKAEAIKILKDEIIDLVCQLATGRLNQVYPIVDHAKQLIALEAALLEESAAQAKPVLAVDELDGAHDEIAPVSADEF